jgi:hypothetical protein
LEIWINAAVIQVTDDPAHWIHRPRLAQAPVLVDEQIKFVAIAAACLVIHPCTLNEAPQKSHWVTSPSLQEHVRHHAAGVVSAVIHVDCVANVYAVLQCEWA